VVKGRKKAHLLLDSGCRKPREEDAP